MFNLTSSLEPIIWLLQNTAQWTKNLKPVQQIICVRVVVRLPQKAKKSTFFEIFSSLRSWKFFQKVVDFNCQPFEANISVSLCCIFSDFRALCIESYCKVQISYMNKKIFLFFFLQVVTNITIYVVVLVQDFQLRGKRDLTEKEPKCAKQKWYLSVCSEKSRLAQWAKTRKKVHSGRT